MTQADRWLLPDGLEEILPETARSVETLRRSLLDLFHGWGYELVIPPLIEYADSLLIGLGSDMDIHSFKMVDQLNGRLLAVRPDITPQVARIDAHSLRREGLARLCYAGSVLHTKPKSLLASRSPIQVGAELYGEASVEADSEIISLMLQTLKTAELKNITLDLGHVGIFDVLAKQAQLSGSQKQEVFEALQRKSISDLDKLIQQYVTDATLAGAFIKLAGLHGGTEIIEQARSSFADFGAEITTALNQLAAIVEVIERRYQDVECYIDLAELTGFHYHQGLVFAAYTDGYGQAIANGGRYDNIGEQFGRARPATGFSLELKALAMQSVAKNIQQQRRIFAPQQCEISVVQKLRDNGEIVICAMAGQQTPADVDAILVSDNGQWRVEAINK
jgi:ATP phosphoribosyltransferase regulatory subunit